MSDLKCRACPTLPLRYGGIQAVVTPIASTASLAALAIDASRTFRRRGLPVEVTADDESVCLCSSIAPSRYAAFRDVLELWAADACCTVRACEEIDARGAESERGSFRDAQSLAGVCEERLARAGRDLGFAPPSGGWGRWAQAAGGSPDTLPSLEEAYRALGSGRLSRFPDRDLEVARQATSAPYGLPAVLVRFKGTCRLFFERFGLNLLEASPRVICITEVAPAVALVENTPPVDGIWDESRFWAAWRALPTEAWDLTDGWAAVRMLRYVKSGDRCWKFYDPAHHPDHVVHCAEDLPPVPFPSRVVLRGELKAWRYRRCCEIALALQPGEQVDPWLRRQVIGRLAIPHPFLSQINRGVEAARAIDSWLARAASVLHAAILGSGAVADAGLTEAVVTNLHDVLQLLLSLPAASEAAPVIEPSSREASRQPLLTACPL